MPISPRRPDASHLRLRGGYAPEWAIHRIGPMPAHLEPNVLPRCRATRRSTRAILGGSPLGPPRMARLRGSWGPIHGWYRVLRVTLGSPL